MRQFAIFDLDDTLLDFTRGEKEGITAILKKYGVTDLEHGLQVYLAHNHDVWHQIEQGADRDALLNSRFQIVFARLGITVDGVALQQEYLNLVAHNFYTVPGAADLLAHLQQAGVHLIVGTNGTKATQMNRVIGAHLDQYFDQVYISESVGYPKPDARFFETIFSHNPDMTTTNTVMVGDSLQSDILGAQHADLDSIWYNPKNLPLSTDLHPIANVDNFEAIQNLILA